MRKGILNCPMHGKEGAESPARHDVSCHCPPIAAGCAGFSPPCNAARETPIFSIGKAQGKQAKPYQARRTVNVGLATPRDGKRRLAAGEVMRVPLESFPFEMRSWGLLAPKPLGRGMIPLHPQWPAGALRRPAKWGD